MAGVQLTEGPLVAEAPADIFFPHPCALSSNARAGVGDTNTCLRQRHQWRRLRIVRVAGREAGNRGRPLLAARNPRRQPLNQGRHYGGERRSQLLLHLLLDNLQNPRHLCLEFLNLMRLAFRAGLSLLSPTSIIV